MQIVQVGIKTVSAECLSADITTTLKENCDRLLVKLADEGYAGQVQSISHAITPMGADRYLITIIAVRHEA